jgi:glycopeptide antibiotics resistance protein
LNKKVFVITIAVLLIITIVACVQTAFVKADNQSSTIEAANSSINQAFSNILAAEKVGGNVTELLKRLITAGDLLAEAENAYWSGSLENITSKVDNATLIADQVNSAALNLREVSLIESQNSFWFTVIFSVVGTVVFGIVLLFVWRRFKRSYMKKLLSMKPEVLDNTT